MTRAPSVLLFLSCLAALPVTASGQDSADPRPASAGLLLGAGIGSSNVPGGLNPFGFTVGARGGYSMDTGLYLGGTFLYHKGDENNLPESVMMFRLGAEVGSQVRAGAIVVRPYAGLGLNIMRATSGDVGADTFAPRDSTTLNAYLDLGVTALYPISRYFVGADVRLSSVLSDDMVGGFVLCATGGMTF